MILLDTKVLVWLAVDDRRLGAQTRDVIDIAWSESQAAVSAISFWELAMLHEKRSLTLLRDVVSWRQDLLRDGLIEVAVDGEIGIRAAHLTDFHADPADRIMVATALEGHQLLTADQKVLDWPGQVSRLAARE